MRNAPRPVDLEPRMNLLDVGQRLAPPLIRRRKLGWIGVDVGTQTVKIAQVSLHEGRPRIVQGIAVTNQAGSLLDETDTAADWITRAVRNGLTARRGFHGSTAACTLSGAATELRAIDLPAGTDDQCRELVLEELGGLERIRNVQFDYWDVPTPGDGNPERLRQVNVLSVSRPLADRVAECLLDAGLTCRVLDGRPFALARAGRWLASMKTTAPVGILDWGHSTATLVIARDGRPLFTRTLRDVGLKRFTDAVARGFGFTAEECRFLLSTYGLPDPVRESTLELVELQHAVAQVGKDPLAQFVDELDRTLTYLKTQRPGIAPGRLWLCGGGATIRNADAHLASVVDLPISRWKLSRSCDVKGAPAELLAQAMALSALAWES